METSKFHRLREPWMYVDSDTHTFAVLDFNFDPALARKSRGNGDDVVISCRQNLFGCYWTLQ